MYVSQKIAVVIDNRLYSDRSALWAALARVIALKCAAVGSGYDIGGVRDVNLDLAFPLRLISISACITGSFLSLPPV